MHGPHDLDETSNVATCHQTGELALLRRDVLLGVVQAVLEGVLHDLLQPVVDFLPGPGDAL